MIIFRGVDMETVAPVKIKDFKVSPLTLSPVTRDRPIFAGADFVRMQEKPRTVTIIFAILQEAYEKRQAAIEAVEQWALSEQPAPMALPFHNGKLLDVICTGLPNTSTREWWESNLTLTFTAFDPYFYENFERSASCGTAFFVSGDAPPKMRIERTVAGAASNQAYSDGMDTMTFSTIPAGDLVIDLNRQTAKVGASSIMEYFSLLSTFIIPKIGTTTISGTGTVKWCERWKE